MIPTPPKIFLPERLRISDAGANAGSGLVSHTARLMCAEVSKSDGSQVGASHQSRG